MDEPGGARGAGRGADAYAGVPSRSAQCVGRPLLVARGVAVKLRARAPRAEFGNAGPLAVLESGMTAVAGVLLARGQGRAPAGAARRRWGRSNRSTAYRPGRVGVHQLPACCCHMVTVEDDSTWCHDPLLLPIDATATAAHVPPLSSAAEPQPEVSRRGNPGESLTAGCRLAARWLLATAGPAAGARSTACGRHQL